MQLIDLPVPDSAAAVAAREVAAQYCSTHLLNHSVRAYMRSGLAERITTNPLDAGE